jgi:hypothetical protein
MGELANAMATESLAYSLESFGSFKKARELAWVFQTPELWRKGSREFAQLRDVPSRR